METKLLTVLGLGALMLSSCYRSDIDNLQEQIDALKSNQIASVESQVENISASIVNLSQTEQSLSAYITELKSQVSKLESSSSTSSTDITVIKEQIDTLLKVDSRLEEKIGELRAYIGTSRKETEDWVNATFATLAQYDSLCTVVAGIPALIDATNNRIGELRTELTESCTEAIRSAVSQSEESMKLWVNAQLDGYYTIEETDARIRIVEGSLADFRSAVSDSLEARRKSLDTLKIELTKSYTSAIRTAITTLEGRLSSALKDSISSVNARLDDSVKVINSRLTAMETRLANLEAEIPGLLSRVQSISVIPTYDDGTVLVTGGNDTICFDVRPAAIADSIARVWKDASTYGVERDGLVSIRRKAVKTKSAANPEGLEVAVDTVVYDSVTEEFKVVAEFTNPDTSAVASLYLAYGSTDISSEYFRVYYKSVLLPGKFSVSATKQVQFTSGNLYYSATDSKYHIEAAQNVTYATLGQSSYDDTHVCHFFWSNITDWQAPGKEPWASSLPYSSQITGDKFFCRIDNPMTLDGQSGLYALTGGSTGEWNYLLNTRKVTVSGKSETSYGEGSVNGVNGLIILPDNWDGSVFSGFTYGTSSYSNVFTYSTTPNWSDMESAGCVCLPAAGYRGGSTLFNAGSFGDYWSASPYGNYKYDAYYLIFNGSYVYPSSYSYRNIGHSVRLVCSVSTD